MFVVVVGDFCSLDLVRILEVLGQLSVVQHHVLPAHPTPVEDHPDDLLLWVAVQLPVLGHHHLVEPGEVLPDAGEGDHLVALAAEDLDTVGQPVAVLLLPDQGDRSRPLEVPFLPSCRALLLQCGLLHTHVTGLLVGARLWATTSLSALYTPSKLLSLSVTPADHKVSALSRPRGTWLQN